MLQQGQEQYPLPTSKLLSPIPKAGSFEFAGSNVPAAIPSDPMFWSNRVESIPESVVTGVGRVSGEKKQETGNGYRLFGFQLVDSSPVEDTAIPATAYGGVGEDLPVRSLDTDLDGQSQPSNTTSDNPAASSEPEKSCLRSPQEMLSRQIRSCTKVFYDSISLSVLLLVEMLSCFYILVSIAPPRLAQVARDLVESMQLGSTLKTSLLLNIWPPRFFFLFSFYFPFWFLLNIVGQPCPTHSHKQFIRQCLVGT